MTGLAIIVVLLVLVVILSISVSALSGSHKSNHHKLKNSKDPEPFDYHEYMTGMPRKRKNKK